MITFNNIPHLSFKPFKVNVEADLAPTTLKVRNFMYALRNHPDIDWVLNVVRHCTSQTGTRIGITMDKRPYIHKELPLSEDCQSAIFKNCHEGLACGWLLGPYHIDDPQRPEAVVSPMFAVAKKDSDKMRSIHDFKASKINESIDSDYFSPVYGTFEQAKSNLIKCGRGAWQVKHDIDHAFRNVRVHRDDWFFTAFRVGCWIFVDTRLAFGSSSSPWLWNQVVLALLWIVSQLGVKLLTDYVDDFHLCAVTEHEALRQAKIFEDTCKWLGIPLSRSKYRIGQTIEFLGIILCSVTWTIYIAEEKRIALLNLVNEWLDRSTATRREIESLVGKLLWTSRAYRDGGMFCRGLISAFKGQNPFTKLNVKTLTTFQFDLSWWSIVLQSPSKCTITEAPFIPELLFHSDACLFGGGALFQNKWIAINWNSWHDQKRLQMDNLLHINILELLAILVSCASWGHLFKGCRITVYCDNTASVAAVNRRKPDNAVMMSLIRRLFFLEHHFDFRLQARWLAGRTNHSADFLSRDMIASFRAINPLADASPSTARWDLIPHFDDFDITLPSLDEAVFSGCW